MSEIYVGIWIVCTVAGMLAMYLVGFHYGEKLTLRRMGPQLQWMADRQSQKPHPLEKLFMEIGMERASEMLSPESQQPTEQTLKSTGTAKERK